MILNMWAFLFGINADLLKINVYIFFRRRGLFYTISLMSMVKKAK